MSTRRRWLRVLLIGLAVFGALLASAAVYLLYVDHGYLRPEVERRLTTMLGRRVSIDGIMHLRIGSTTRISVDGLRIASESWSKAPYLAAVGRMVVTIDTASLLGGPVEIETLRVDEVRVALEKLPDGRVNWVLGQPGAVPGRRSGELPVVVREVAVRDSRVEFDSPDFEAPLLLAVESLEQVFDKAGGVSTRATGSINSTPLTFEGRLDDLDALLDRRNVRTEFAASLGEIELEGRVVIDDLGQPHRPIVHLQLAGPDFAYLAEILKLKVQANGPLAARAELTPDGERMRFDVETSVGKFHLAAAGHVDDLRAPRVVEASIDSSGPNLANVARVFDLRGVPAKPFTLAGHIGNDGDRIVLRDVRAKLGDTEVRASGSVQPGGRPGIDLVLESEHLDLGEYLPDSPAGPLALRMKIVPDGEKSKFDVDGTLGDLRIEALGVLDDLDSPQAIDAEVDAAGPDLAAAARLFGIDGAPAGSFAVDGYVGWHSGQIVFRDTGVRLGQVKLHGSGSVRAGTRPTIDVTVHSERLDLREYLPQVPAAPTPAAAGTNRPERLIPDEPLPFDSLQGLDVRLDAVAKQVIAGPRSLSDISLKARISDGVLTIPEFVFVGERGGRFEGAVVVRPNGAGGQVGLRVDGRGLNLGLPAANPEERAALPHYDVRVMLDSKGSTARQLAASANGYIRIRSGKGKLRMRNIRLFTDAFLSELLSKVDPFLEDDPYTNVECAWVAAVVENGELSGEPGLVLQSDRLVIAAGARIDLHSEILDADIHTVPRKGLGVSLSSFVNPYIKVGGTLARPSFEIDPKSTFLEGGAAIMTGGVSILAKSMFERVTASADPCGDAAVAAEPAIRKIEEQYGGELSTD